GDDVERTMKVDQQPRGARRGRVEQLGVQAAIERPLIRGHVALLEQSAREDLRVLVPCTVEYPAPAESTHAPHRREARREEVELEMHRVRMHLILAGVETLEPRILGVDALESHLKAEARGERARERGLAGADHAGDAEEHSPNYFGTAN